VQTMFNPASLSFRDQQAASRLSFLLVGCLMAVSGAAASLESGSVTAWGFDHAVPSGLSNVRRIALGSQDESFWGVALLDDGTAVSWGDGKTNSGVFPDFGQTMLPDGIGSARDVTAGAFHCLALKADGTVACWGTISNSPTGLTDAVAIAAGERHCLAVRRDGTVAAWGSDDYGQIEVPAGLTNVVAVAGGAGHSLAAKSDGTVVAWGDHAYSQCDIPAGLSNVIAVSAGHWHSLALKSDGTVVGWGDNRSGQATPPAGLTNVIAIDAGWFHSLALKSDGTVVGWAHELDLPVPSGLSNVVSIAGGGMESAVITAPLKAVLQFAGPTPSIQFRTFAGQSYSVQFSAEPGVAAWANLLDHPLIGDGRTIEVPDANAPPAAAARFYRIKRL